jgi:predicted aldo/keto reductase-like oxidoreductase
VNIPGCFESYNNVYLGNPMQSKVMYMMSMGGGLGGDGPKSYASQCKNCGKCVKVCTQHIDIPVKLKEASRELESPGMKAMLFVARPVVGTYMSYSRWKTMRKARV